MSLLTLCQEIVDETGIGSTPSTIISNTDPLAVQLLATAKGEVVRLSRRHTWQAITAEHTITTVNGTDNYALPADWSRYICNTFWDTTNFWPMRGSIDPQMWTALKRGIVTGIQTRRDFRVKAGKVYIYPTPTVDGNTLIGEYVTNKPFSSSTGTAQSTFSADSDTTLIPENLVKLGVKWRIKYAKGLDYSEDKDEYERQFLIYAAEDTPGRTLNYGPIRSRFPMIYPNLPQQIS